jgi:FlaA1/EpsC-like NDP-sugar epimerase
MQNKTILITGGTGSLGQALVGHLLSDQNRRLDLMPRKVIVYSRGENKQVEMRRKYLGNTHIRFCIGDVRDRNRLYRALDGVDYVIHLAAQKHVATCQYNPWEALQTNSVGMQHVADAAIDRGVEKVLAVSSDKSVNPINLYGATKLCADHLAIASNNMSKSGLVTKLSVIRFGNFIGSRGSIIPYFQELIDKGERVLPITNFEATRFWIPIDEAVELTLQALGEMQGSEIFTPKMLASPVVDFVRGYFGDKDYDMRFEEVGLGEGEKLHEDLITRDDARHTYETDKWYITLTPKCPVPDGARPVDADFSYSSDRGLPWRD